MKRVIGVIAGNGDYPRLFIEGARASLGTNVKLIIAAFYGDTRQDLSKISDEMEWFKVGQLERMMKFFATHQVSETVMVGQVSPSNLYRFRPDLRTVKLLAKLKVRNAESLFSAIGSELEKEKMPLLSAVTFMEKHLCKEGRIYGPKEKRWMQDDAEYGFKIAKESSRLDIGQSVIIREGTVLAVEAFEGTNECIVRGGGLGKGKNLTLVKVSKEKQDFRFDVPVIGPTTLEKCRRSGVQQIAIEAGRTLVLESDQVRYLANRWKISVVGMS